MQTVFRLVLRSRPFGGYSLGMWIVTSTPLATGVPRWPRVACRRRGWQGESSAGEKYPDLATKSPVAILSDFTIVPEAVRTPVRNNLGGHWNHSFFWELMTPGGAKEPSGDLKSAIDSSFGATAKLIEKVNAAGLARFGSGWAWLIVDKNGKLNIVSTPNQDTPLEQGVKRVVLGVDVWEHAYYLKYQNRRADYLAAWWNTVNWDKAAANFAKAPA
jgi:superoxide dismutase, Fe-Mn family